MTDTAAIDLLLVESRVANRSPSMGVAYLCCIFVGLLGVHRFYLRRPGSGLLYLFTLGLAGVGVLADLFLIPGMVRKDREKIRASELDELRARQAVRPETYTVPAPSVDADVVRALLAERFST
jgi:hypothetical protein